MNQGAERIAQTLIGRFGTKNVHWAMMFVAFIVGIPVFFRSVFVLLIPLLFYNCHWKQAFRS
ncbi:hypothetical protein ACEQPO_29430 [Bacillus sp. SL00103]